MKLTVCEMHDEPAAFARDWDALAAHARLRGSDVVLLPEMPFYRFFAARKPFDPAVWRAAGEAHETWLARLPELAPAVVVGSRPVEIDGRRLNEGFVWDAASGYRAAHTKYYLPEEEDCWEASWYQRGAGDFTPIRSGALGIGFQICSELWFLERARAYGRDGVHLIVTPRATGKVTVDKWLVGGRAAAVVSGAFAASSNRVSSEGSAPAFGGQGWVVGPDGDVLGLTSPHDPFVTVDIDLSQAERAKQTYPRYMAD